jgi:hypothetical protein
VQNFVGRKWLENVPIFLGRRGYGAVNVHEYLRRKDYGGFIL